MSTVLETGLDRACIRYAGNVRLLAQPHEAQTGGLYFHMALDEDPT